MKRNYHKERCQSCVRQIHKINEEITIIVTGQHAFNWTVTIKKCSDIKSLILSNRVEALKEVIILKRQYRQFGDCNFKL